MPGIVPENKFFEVLPKYATFIGIVCIAYLQTLFPSKSDFQQLTKQFVEIDKKITELSFVQIIVNQQQLKLADIDIRLRQLELEIVKVKVEVTDSRKN